MNDKQSSKAEKIRQMAGWNDVSSRSLNESDSLKKKTAEFVKPAEVEEHTAE